MANGWSGLGVDTSEWGGWANWWKPSEWFGWGQPQATTAPSSVATINEFGELDQATQNALRANRNAQPSGNPVGYNWVWGYSPDKGKEEWALEPITPGKEEPSPYLAQMNELEVETARTNLEYLRMQMQNLANSGQLTESDMAKLDMQARSIEADLYRYGLESQSQMANIEMLRQRYYNEFQTAQQGLALQGAEWFAGLQAQPANWIERWYAEHQPFGAEMPAGLGGAAYPEWLKPQPYQAAPTGQYQMPQIPQYEGYGGSPVPYIPPQLPQRNEFQDALTQWRQAASQYEQTGQWPEPTDLGGTVVRGTTEGGMYPEVDILSPEEQSQWLAMRRSTGWNPTPQELRQAYETGGIPAAMREAGFGHGAFTREELWEVVPELEMPRADILEQAGIEAFPGWTQGTRKDFLEAVKVIAGTKVVDNALTHLPPSASTAGGGWAGGWAAPAPVSAPAAAPAVTSGTWSAPGGATGTWGGGFGW